MVPYSDYAPTTTTSSDGAYMVCSDAPVLVHGLYTSSVPYEVCKNWTADEWCFFGNEISCQVLTFSTEKVVTVTLPKDNPEDPEEEAGETGEGEGGEEENGDEAQEAYEG